MKQTNFQTLFQPEKQDQEESPQPKPTDSLSERIITLLIRSSGYLSILFVSLICIFLLKEGMPALLNVPPASLFGMTWYPIEGYFGILPLILGSLLITVSAVFIAVIFGIATAVFMSEVAPNWINEILKPLVEILAGFPSVVLGFIGILALSPSLRILLNLPTGLTAFTGALLLGWAAIPTIVSVSEDALNSVPRSYREASLALGATPWQTIWGVTLQAARSGILTGVMLGIGRVIGETMTVMMVTGNAPVIPASLDALFMPVRTMTATIASEMGEVAKGSTHYQVLFLIGIILFLFSLIINTVVFVISSRRLSHSDRLLS
ncbi:MAG: phosphate ABC transporter permease subunit PstC [Chloroflexota bacterium]|jgi:phosphate transport system permease protein